MAYDAQSLHSKSAILGDSSSGEIIFKHNPDEKLPIASVTKIMTMLLVMEAIDNKSISLDDIVTVSETAAIKSGSHIFLAPNEQMSVNDLLKGVAVSSGNDAAIALAEHIAGTHEQFIVMMNEKAKSLGMKNTNFSSCNGLDDTNNYSSAYDVFIMTKELLKHKAILNYTGIWMDTLRNGQFSLSNTNKLIRFYKGATGMKTGSTSIAGFCLSATALRDNLHLISVVLGADSSQHRFLDASNLLNYGFSAYKAVKLSKKGEVFGYNNVHKGKSKLCSVIYNDELDVMLKKDINKDKIEMIVENNETTVAPVKKGDNAGSITYKLGDKILGKIELVYNENVAKIDFPYIFKEMLIKSLS